MSKQITIQPVTRIEGHAKITLHLDDAGAVEDARFHVTQFRGFEKFCQGRPLQEMPSITARICGICPVSHMIASGKACDALLAVRIPQTAVNLRRLLVLAELVQSHALSFFHLSSPDLLLGMDADPAERNVFGLIERYPELARRGIALRKYGQQVIEWLAGKRIHAAWVDAGGVNNPLDEQRRDLIAAGLPDALEAARATLDQFGDMLANFETEVATFGNFPSAHMGLVDAQGRLEHYDGLLRMVDADGTRLVDDAGPADYRDLIAEKTEPWTFLKFPYYKPRGYPDGMYRVGPLSRLNVADSCGTPLADAALEDFRALADGPVSSSFHYHYARLIEIVHCLERMQEMIDDPQITDPRVKANAQPNAEEGIGVAEAPRGTLIHHYKIDDQGRIRWMNLIVATGHNNLAMNAGVRQVARHFVKGGRLEEGMLNRVEAVIRAFDPCLSCSTHAAGQMPLIVQLMDAGGRFLDEKRRD